MQIFEIGVDSSWFLLRYCEDDGIRAGLWPLGIMLLTLDLTPGVRLGYFTLGALLEGKYLFTSLNLESLTIVFCKPGIPLMEAASHVRERKHDFQCVEVKYADQVRKIVNKILATLS